LKQIIPPHYLELVAAAALQSYWRRKSLALFLRRCGVKEPFLAAWSKDESKRDLLYRLFPKLEASGDAGLQLVNRMTDALVQQESFPDLEGWEDSKKKIEDANLKATAVPICPSLPHAIGDHSRPREPLSSNPPQRLGCPILCSLTRKGWECSRSTRRLSRHPIRKGTRSRVP